MALRTFSRLAAVLLVSGMFLAACGTSKQPSNGAQPGTPVKGGQLVIGVGGDASYLNPVVASDGASYKYNWLIFDGLVELDENLKIKPLLAQTWDISPDGLSYTFHLNPKAKWHDGQPVTADDVAFTFYKLLDPTTQTQNRAFFDALVGFPELTDPKNPKKPEELAKKPIEVIDPATVKFNLRYPYAPFLSVLVSPRGGIVPKHVLEGKDINKDAFNQKPVGSGPFKVVEWKKDNRLVLEANPDYFLGRPQLDRIIIRVIPDPVVRVQELKSGGIDLVDTPPLEEVAAYKNDPQFQVITASTPSYHYFGFLLDNPLFQEKKVRQAITYAVDFDVIIKKVLQGYATRATGPWPPSSWANNPNVKPYPYDVEKSRQLLAEAGWKPGPDGILVKDGKRFEFSVKGDQASQNVKDATVIMQEQLGKVGIKLNITLLDWPTFVKHLFASEFDTVLVSWTSHPDPDPFAYTVFHSSQMKNRNFAHYTNPQVDELLTKARQTNDIEQRKQYYWKVQELLHEDANYVWGYYPEEVYIARAQYQGIKTIPAQAAIFQSLRAVSVKGK
jgi:peptide/nickel transport system substrate-binding protein